MTIFSGFTREKIPTVEQVLDVALTPQTNVNVNSAIRQSVQEFPPAINTGAFFAELVRGPLLPPFGTKDRDRVLRLMYRGEYNNLVQAVVSSLIKKIVTVPWQLTGDRTTLVSVPDEFGRLRTISAVDHYQNVLQNAQFGAGWEVFLSMYLEDFFTQDFGGVMELIGPGEPVGPVMGPVMGIAQLDSGRCYITGNPYYPIMYFSLISGSLHRMHTSRIVRLVDSPSPDERYFRIGLSALSRVVAVANRQQLMARYIEGLVDDKPPPGFMLTQGFTEKQRNNAIEAYKREQSSDDRPVWGKTLWIYSLDADKPIKAEHFAFSQAPEKFDWVKYTELDVHALAAGFNIDVQEIWELTGRGGAGGNSGQSQLLHQKSEAKMLGFLLQNLERAFNRRVLPPDVQLEFKYHDPIQQENEATVDGQLATNAVALQTAGLFNSLEGRRYLAAQSDRYKDAINANRATVIAPDASDDVEIEASTTTDVTPSPSQVAAANVPQLGPGGQSPTPPTGQQPKPASGIAPKLPTGAPAQKPTASQKRPVPAGPLNAAHASNPRKQRPGNMQRPSNGVNANLRSKEFASDEQRRAFFGNLAAGTLSGGNGSRSSASSKLEKMHSEIKKRPDADLSKVKKGDYLASKTGTGDVYKVGDAKNGSVTITHYHPDGSSGYSLKVAQDSTGLTSISKDEVSQAQQLRGATLSKEPDITPPAQTALDKLSSKTSEQFNHLAQSNSGGGYFSKPGVSMGRVKVTQGSLNELVKHGLISDEGEGYYRMTPLGQSASNLIYKSLKSLRAKAFTVTAHDFERRFTKALVRGVDGKIDRDAFESALLDMLASSALKAYADGLSAGGANPELRDEHTGDIQNFLVGQIDFIDNLGKALHDGELNPTGPVTKDIGDVLAVIRRKARIWVSKSLRQMYEAGRLFANPDGMYEFTGLDGKESCETCQRLDGQVHALKEWHAAGLVPQIDTDGYECKGYQCRHILVKTDKPEFGEF